MDGGMRTDLAPRLIAVALLAVAALGLTGCGLLRRDADVLLVGDSIMNQSGPYVQERLRVQPALSDVSVHLEAVNGSGLLTPDLQDWRAEAVALAEQYAPEVTVLLFVGNYTNDDLWTGADGLPVAPDYSERFFDEWRLQATELSRELQATGTQVYWVLPPPFYGDEGARRERLLRDAYLQVARDVPGVGLIDGRAALGGTNGEFVWELPSLDDGAPVPVRQGDSLHVTPDGGERLAAQMVTELSPLLTELRQQRSVNP